jgi:hypothetical protein
MPVDTVQSEIIPYGRLGSNPNSADSQVRDQVSLIELAAHLGRHAQEFENMVYQTLQEIIPPHEAHQALHVRKMVEGNRIRYSLLIYYTKRLRYRIRSKVIYV